MIRKAPIAIALLAAAWLAPVPAAAANKDIAGFVAGELKHPERDMPRALLLGMVGVAALYLSVNWVCLRVLGPADLAASTAPASEVMRRTFGERGAAFLAAAVTVSTLGFLSQGILTAPRVYYAMARDGLFFRALAFVHPKTRVPVLAIVLKGVWAAVIALSGRYEQIINYVVSADFIWFGLTGLSLFVFRRRGERGAFPTPGHPYTTVFYIAGWANY